MLPNLSDDEEPTACGHKDSNALLLSPPSQTKVSAREVEAPPSQTKVPAREVETPPSQTKTREVETRAVKADADAVACLGDMCADILGSIVGFLKIKEMFVYRRVGKQWYV